MNKYSQILKNPAEAFCLNIRVDNEELITNFEWQLHEGIYRLSQDYDSSFGSLDNVICIFEQSKNITIVNSGYRSDLSIANVLLELIDTLSSLSIRKASTVLLALFATSTEQMNTMHRCLTQFEAVSGRFEYEYLLQLMPHYPKGQSRGVLAISE